MAKDQGWIKLYRSSFNNKLYFSEPFTRWQAWADLLLIANHMEGWIRIRGIKQIVLRGQIGYSTPVLQKRWKWLSKGKVIRFLNELRDEHQVVLQKTNVTTLISIVNYNKYQLDDTANDTANSTANVPANDTANGTQMIPQNLITNMNINELQASKNEKNEKNDKEEKIKENIPAMVLTTPAPPSVIYPLHYNYNILPKEYSDMVIKLVRSTKQVDVFIEDITALWDVFKEQNLTGEKPYKDERDFYRHFVNWSNKQSFRKKPKPREPKSKVSKSENILGVEFINDFSEVKMSDGSIQALTKNQTDSARFNQINPKSIKKV